MKTAPKKLTPALTKRVREETARVRGEDDGDPAPPSPLDWVAAHAGVRKYTLTRWVKYGVAIRQSGRTGKRADPWLRFVDAIDALMSACADYRCGKIAEIAGKPGAKQLDAHLALLKRSDAQEQRLDAVDVEIDANDAVSHIPQEEMDALTDQEMDTLISAQQSLAATQRVIATTLAAARDRLDPS